MSSTMSGEPDGRRVDPGDAPAPDAVDDACGMVVKVLRYVSADMKLDVDDECTAEIEGEYATFCLPSIRVRVRVEKYADMMAREVIEELSVLAHVAETCQLT